MAGLFSSASKIPALLNIFTSIFQQSWQLTSVEEYQQFKNSSFFSKVFCKYSFFCLFLCSLLIMAVPFVSKIVLLGEFYNAWVYTPMLLFSALLGCYSTFLGTFYSVVKNNKRAMFSTLWGAISNLLICFITIPFIGVIGALIANGISYLIVVFVRMKDVKQYVNIQIDMSKLVVGLIVCLCQSVSIMMNLYIGLIVSITSIGIILYEFRGDLFDLINNIKR